MQTTPIAIWPPTSVDTARYRDLAHSDFLVVAHCSHERSTIDMVAGIKFSPFTGTTPSFSMAEAPTQAKSADAIEWREGFKIGVSQADLEHRHLFELVQALNLACVQDGVAELMEGVASHFSSEQDLMEKSGYPALEQHVELHREFAAQVHDFLAAVQVWSEDHVQELRHLDRKSVV